MSRRVLLFCFLGFEFSPDSSFLLDFRIEITYNIDTKVKFFREGSVMNLPNAIAQYFEAGNAVLTTAQVQELGFSKTSLANYVRSGLLERVGHGFYRLPGEVLDDLFDLSLHSKKLIFSHDSALFLNGISDRTPFQHSVTIPSNAALTASIKDLCTCFYIRPDLHALGRITRTTPFGHPVPCYNMERTLCDFLRSRSRCDEEMFLSALKNYAAQPNKNLNRLADYANRFRVKAPLKQYLEVLL